VLAWLVTAAVAYGERSTQLSESTPAYGGGRRRRVSYANSARPLCHGVRLRFAAAAAGPNGPEDISRWPSYTARKRSNRHCAATPPAGRPGQRTSTRRRSWAALMSQPPRRRRRRQRQRARLVCIVLPALAASSPSRPLHASSSELGVPGADDRQRHQNKSPSAGFRRTNQLSAGAAAAKGGSQAGQPRSQRRRVASVFAWRERPQISDCTSRRVVVVSNGEANKSDYRICRQREQSPDNQ
jgi:hypothetical protein